ncbi:hypothetical protein [Saccharothrix hoggarensis]|uniref:Uncharacterized protein n=1 Tax=Saccharothrix hoggarensis TaxID=913853 RepID=A0ABW3QSM0_9PSEU
MRLSVIAHPVVRHAPLHRVLVPAARLRNLWVRPPEPITGMAAVTGSRADLVRLGALVRLAATSRHSALFIPARDNVPPEELWRMGHARPADLLVVRRDVGLRPSDWPGVRRALRRSTARPARVDEVFTEPDVALDVHGRDPIFHKRRWA